jgi:hypothetical protein
MPNEQIAVPVFKVDREKIATARHIKPPVPGHAAQYRNPNKIETSPKETLT